MSKTFARSPLAPASFPDLPSIQGVEFVTHSLGLYGDRDDMFVAHFPGGAATGGVFTVSTTASADVRWCRKALADGGGNARALVVNAGNSNAFTGKAGEAKNAATVAAVGQLTGCDDNEVFLAATGVIGVALDKDLVANGVNAIWPKLGSSTLAGVGRAFMTTDTFAKAACATAEIDGRTVSIAGVAKGSGMIAPNMATMLAYVFTDANLSPAVCQSLLSEDVESTFNAVTVDSDTSTSDTLMMFATGAAGGEQTTAASDPRLADFRKALHGVLHDLALQIVRDGEGATKLIRIDVQGAASDASARIIAAGIANSPLVKTALAASDANWGRIVMAAGKTGEPINQDKLALWLGDVQVAENGQVRPSYTEAAGAAECARQEISIRVDVGAGAGASTVWTCDLTHAYIDINGAYRT